MSTLQDRPLTDADIEQLASYFRKSNETMNYCSHSHPIPYRIAIFTEDHGLVQELPVTDEWPPDPNLMQQRLLQLSRDPCVEQQVLTLAIGSRDDPREIYLWATPTFTVTPDGRRSAIPEPRYFVGYGQYIAAVQHETLRATPGMLMPGLVATTAHPLHVAWMGGKCAPNPAGDDDLMSFQYDHHPLPLDCPFDVTEFIQQVWESIEDAPHSELPTAQRRTEFQLAILSEPPEPMDAPPQYPNIPVPVGALELQRSFIAQPAADNPSANFLTEVTIAPNWPLAETAKLIAAILPEIVPFAYDSQAELDAAVSKRRQH